MGLEATFYILGIITMTLWIILFIVILAAILRIRSEVNNFKSGFTGKIVGLLKERNVEVASALGLTVAHFFIDKIKKAIDKKKA